MKTFEITLVISHPESDDEKLISTLFENGCDDFTMSVQRGARVLDFDREAPTYAAALHSACASVISVGGKVVRTEPDNLVTMADIAKRLDRTRQAISQYVAGTRREQFPAPVARVTAENPLWDWVQVLEWFARGRDTAVTSDRLDEARAIKRATETPQLMSVEDLGNAITAKIPTVLDQYEQYCDVIEEIKANSTSVVILSYGVHPINHGWEFRR